jgi:hypothetical protein
MAVYSRTDGIVDWRACLDPAARHVEVHSSHVGMSVHPGVYRAIAGALPGFWPPAEVVPLRRRTASAAGPAQTGDAPRIP